MANDGPPAGAGPVGLEGIELRHALPGRVRIRVPGIKGQPAVARAVQQQLAGLKVVRRVEVSALTGSVLVLYDAADTPALAELGRMVIPGLDLDGAPAAADGASPAADAATESIADYFRQLNAQVEAATGGPDLKVLLPASLFLCGIVGLLTGKRVTSPHWYDYLWFAFGTFFTLNRPPASAGAAPAPEPAAVPAHVNGAQA